MGKERVEEVVWFVHSFHWRKTMVSSHGCVSSCKTMTFQAGHFLRRTLRRMQSVWHPHPRNASHSPSHCVSQTPPHIFSHLQEAVLHPPPPSQEQLPWAVSWKQEWLLLGPFRSECCRPVLLWPQPQWAKEGAGGMVSLGEKVPGCSVLRNGVHEDL